MIPAASGEFLDGHHLRQTEVQNLGVAAFGHKDVCRLNVAVDDALLVRGVQRVDNVDCDFDHPIDGKRVFLHQVLQRFTLQELHGDERTAAFFGDFINCADVGMVQR
jgi:hypothetical protein